MGIKNYPPVRRGTPERFTSAPKVWLRKLCFWPPKGRLDFFCPGGVPSRLPTLPAGLFRPFFNCLNDALSWCVGSGRGELATGAAAGVSVTVSWRRSSSCAARAGEAGVAQGVTQCYIFITLGYRRALRIICAVGVR